MSQAASSLHLKRILVPTDLSAPSARALAYAAAFARQFNAELTVLHVYDQIVSAPAHASPMETYQLVTSIHESLRWEIEQFIKKTLPSSEDAPAYRLEIVDGAPVDEVVNVAGREKFDLIVIATHGRTGLKHILMGSVAEKIVRHAPCPVLVVREQEHDFIDLPKEG